MELTTVAGLKLPQLAHPCAYVLSKAVRMWSKVPIMGGGVHFCKYGGKLQVGYSHVPLGVHVQDNSGLYL